MSENGVISVTFKIGISDGRVFCEDLKQLHDSGFQHPALEAIRNTIQRTIDAGPNCEPQAEVVFPTPESVN